MARRRLRYPVMPRLTSLPTEVLEQILLLVDWRSVLRAQQVSSFSSYQGQSID